MLYIKTRKQSFCSAFHLYHNFEGSTSVPAHNPKRQVCAIKEKEPLESINNGFP